MKAQYGKVPYKYRLTDFFIHECNTGLPEDLQITTNYYSLNSDGVIGGPEYAWDGPSGPTIDTENSIEASLVHDILYQAIREKQIPRRLRRRADKIFRVMLEEAGMSLGRRWAWYWAVRIFGRKAAGK